VAMTETINLPGRSRGEVALLFREVTPQKCQVSIALLWAVDVARIWDSSRAGGIPRPLGARWREVCPRSRPRSWRR
jgi:hypothetical protein